MLDGVVDRRGAGEVATRLGLGDDALGEGELRVAEWEAGCVHVEAGADVVLVPLEVRLVVGRVDLDQGQVVALRDADHLGVVAGVGVATDVDLERRRAGDDVVVGDGVAIGGDEEAAAARTLGVRADLGIAQRPLGDDLDRSRLGVVDAADRTARRGRSVGAVFGRSGGLCRIGGFGDADRCLGRRRCVCWICCVRGLCCFVCGRTAPANAAVVSACGREQPE